MLDPGMQLKSVLPTERLAAQLTTVSNSSIAMRSPVSIKIITIPKSDATNWTRVVRSRRRCQRREVQQGLFVFYPIWKIYIYTKWWFMRIWQQSHNNSNNNNHFQTSADDGGVWNRRQNKSKCRLKCSFIFFFFCFHLPTYNVIVYEDWLI